MSTPPRPPTEGTSKALHGVTRVSDGKVVAIISDGAGTTTLLRARAGPRGHPVHPVDPVYPEVDVESCATSPLSDSSRTA